jgi:hypothetical protein
VYGSDAIENIERRLKLQYLRYLENIYLVLGENSEERNGLPDDNDPMTFLIVGLC